VDIFLLSPSSSWKTAYFGCKLCRNIHSNICLLLFVADAQSSDAGIIGCRIPSRNIELLKNLTVLGNISHKQSHKYYTNDLLVLSHTKNCFHTVYWPVITLSASPLTYYIKYRQSCGYCFSRIRPSVSVSLSVCLSA